MKNLIQILLIITALAACALPTHKVDVTYAPRPDIKLIAGAHTINVAVEVKDSRLEKFRLTSKRNTFIETTDVLVKNDVTSALRWAMESELRNLGFSVNGAPAVYITAELVRFNNDYQIGYINGQAIADMHFHIQVLNSKRQFRYATTISTQSSGEDSILYRGKMTTLALNKTLEVGMDKLFSDKAFINALVKKGE